MASAGMVMYEEEAIKISEILTKLNKDASAKVIFLVDKNGQLVSGAGKVEDYDTTSLASLTAGAIAATGGLAKIIGEKEFAVLFHEGEKDNLHISIISGKMILVVMFDNKTSLGLVQLRVKKASDDLERVFEIITKKTEAYGSSGGPSSELEEITDDDIDNLFN